MRSIKSIKGFKNDKRNLLEATNNLIVFGEGQTPKGGNKSRRRIRREITAARASASKGGSPSVVTIQTKPVQQEQPSQPLVPGPGSALRRLDQITNFDVMSNYFLDTRPWNYPSQKGSYELNTKEREKVLNQSRTPSIVPSSANQKIFRQPQSTADNASFVRFHVCPICSEGFEPLRSKLIPAQDVMKYSMQSYQQKSSVTFRKNLEDGWGAIVKPKGCVKPQDVVVSANCGELFHKVCLRDWCSQGHKSSPRSVKPSANCPSCGKELKYTLCQEMDVNSIFSSEPTSNERELTQTKLVNKELQVLWPETNNYLVKLQNDIKEAETLHQGLRAKKRSVKSQLKKLTAEDLSIVMSKVSDVGSMKSMLEKQEKAIEFMQQETLQIMRMYLLTVLRKMSQSKSHVESRGDFNVHSNNNGSSVATLGTSQLSHFSTFPSSNIIPSTLNPYLQNIMNDDESLLLLSRILSPMHDDYNESKLKILELEIIKKHDPASAANLLRTNTYTVLTSEVNAGNKKELEKGGSKEDETHSSTANLEEENCESVIALKPTTGSHQIIPEKLSCTDLLRNPYALSEHSFLPEKPSKLFEIQEVSSHDSKLVTINSSAELVPIFNKSEEEQGAEISVSDTHEVDEKTHQKRNIEQTEQKDFVSPLANFPLAQSFRTPQWLIENKDRRDASLPSSLEVSVISLYSHFHPPTDLKLATRQRQQHSQNEDRNLNKENDENNVDTLTNNFLNKKELNKNEGMEVEALREELHQETNKNLIELSKHATEIKEEIATTLSQDADDDYTDIESEEEEEGDAANSASWSTVSSNEDHVHHHHQKDERKMFLKDSSKTGAAAHNSISNVLPSTPSPHQLPTAVHPSSCEIVFSNAQKKNKSERMANMEKGNKTRTITMCRGQAPRHSDVSLTSVPEQQVSIAIMYIIDDDGEEEDDDDEQEEEQQSSLEESATILNPPALTVGPSIPATIPEESSSSKVLTPVFIKAQKASNYSVLAEQTSHTTASSSDNAMVLDPSQFRRREPRHSEEFGKASEEQYRPPTISSSNTTAATGRMGRLAGYPPPPQLILKENITVDGNAAAIPATEEAYLKPSLPKINNSSYKTTMFYENEVTSINRLVGGRNRGSSFK